MRVVRLAIDSNQIPRSNFASSLAIVRRSHGGVKVMLTFTDLTPSSAFGAPAPGRTQAMPGSDASWTLPRRRLAMIARKHNDAVEGPVEDFLRVAASPSTPRAYHRRILRRIVEALRERSRAPEPRLPANYVMTDLRERSFG